MTKQLNKLLVKHAESHGFKTISNPVNNKLLLVVRNWGGGCNLYQANTLKQLYIAMGY